MIIRAGRVLLDAERIEPAAIHVEGGRIARITDWRTAVAPHTPLFEFNDDYVVMPGLVDTHVHVNEPGRSEWEGFVSATRAAAAGGVTTLLDMPLNSIPATTSVQALNAKLHAAQGKCWVNVGFLGGVIPGNTEQILPLHEAGVFAFKAFMAPSGVDEFPHVSIADLEQALPVLASVDALLMVHAESPAHLHEVKGDACNYSNYLAARPDAAEVDAIRSLVALSERFGARVHIVHVSSAESLSLLRDAQGRGVRITAETCPHYLTFCAEEISHGATSFKCAPPIRDASHRAALWAALVDGTITQIVSDHSPCPAGLKAQDTGDFSGAWGGIASLQLGLAAVWERACQQAGMFSIGQIATLMSTNPATLAGLGHRKGRIAVGYDADIVVWRPAESITVTPAELYHRHAITPYSGHTLRGRIDTTFVGGHVAYQGGETSAMPFGQLLDAREL